MNKISKFLTIVTTLLITFNTIASAGMTVSAEEGDGLDEETREQIAEDIAEDLEFYFETVGYINEDQEYIVTDEDAFIEKIAEDFGVDLKDIDFDNIDSEVGSTNVGDYVICVVVNSLPFRGVAWERANATSELDGFFNALTAFNFQVAADMLMQVASQYLSAAAMEELASVSLAANIATSLVSCGLE